MNAPFFVPTNTRMLLIIFGSEFATNVPPGAVAGKRKKRGQ
jgi:hypothetical protein